MAGGAVGGGGCLASDQTIHPYALLSKCLLRARADPALCRALHARLPRSLCCGCKQAHPGGHANVGPVTPLSRASVSHLQMGVVAACSSQVVVSIT